MKLLPITAVNFILDPILYLKITKWSKSLSLVKFSRIQYVLLSSNILMFGHRRDVRSMLAKVSLIVFQLDTLIDTKLESNERSVDKILSIVNGGDFKKLIDETFSNLKPLGIEQMENSLKDLIVGDMKALQSDNYLDYLKYSSISVGVHINATLICLMYGKSVGSELLQVSSEIVRLLSDISTYKKDLEEGGNNIVFFIGLVESKSLLKEKLKLFDEFVAKNEPEIFLKRLVSISKIFYKESKDFEL